MKKFFDTATLFDRVQKALFQWLFGDLLEKAQKLLMKVEKLLAGPLNVQSVFQFVIDLAVEVLDLTWENVLKLLKDVIRVVLMIDVDKVQMYVDRAKEVVDLFYHDGMLDVEGGIGALYQKAKEEFKPDELVQTLVEKAKDWLVRTVVTKVLEWVANLAVPGAAVLKLIFDGLQWVIEKAEVIKGFLEKVFGVVDVLLGQSGAGDVAKEVLGVLTAALPQVFDLIGAALGLKDVVKTVKDIGAQPEGQAVGVDQAGAGRADQED